MSFDIDEHLEKCSFDGRNFEVEVVGHSFDQRRVICPNDSNPIVDIRFRLIEANTFGDQLMFVGVRGEQRGELLANLFFGLLFFLVEILADVQRGRFLLDDRQGRGQDLESSVNVVVVLDGERKGSSRVNGLEEIVDQLRTSGQLTLGGGFEGVPRAADRSEILLALLLDHSDQLPNHPVQFRLPALVVTALLRGVFEDDRRDLGTVSVHQLRLDEKSGERGLRAGFAQARRMTLRGRVNAQCRRGFRQRASSFRGVKEIERARSTDATLNHRGTRRAVPFVIRHG